MSRCPCGSGKDFEACCGPILDGQPAETAEALVRARYTSYVVEKTEFLFDTMAPAVRAELDPVESARIAKEADWHGMEVRSVRPAPDDDAVTEVEYIAKFRLDGQVRVHHERARLRRDDGAWMVHDGEVNPKDPPRRVEKVGRNDPCPCGSGKKHKKCCGA